MIIWGNDQSAGATSNEWKWRAIGAILLVTAFFVFAGAAKAEAQNQAAAVRIAENGDPAVILTNPVQCALVLTPVWGQKKTEKYCAKMFREGGGIVKKVNNEAADATKNNWPAISPYGGYGYGGGLAGMNAPGFIPGGGAGGVNVVYGSGVSFGNSGVTSGNGGRNCTSPCGQ